MPNQQRIFRSGLRLCYIWPNLTQTSVTVVTDEWEESLQWQFTDANWINQTKLINLMWIVLGEAYFFIVRVRTWTIGWVHFIRRVYKMRKVTISFTMSVCSSIHPSVRMEQLGSHWTDFREIWYFSIFGKTVKKIQVSLKSDKNKRSFTWRPLDIFDHISLTS